MNEVIEVFKQVFDSMRNSALICNLFALWVGFMVFSFVVRMCLGIVNNYEAKPQKEDEIRVNRIVGKILNDQEKIDYILKTYDDIETASDMIADIYEKQLQEGEKTHD